MAAENQYERIHQETRVDFPFHFYEADDTFFERLGGITGVWNIVNTWKDKMYANRWRYPGIRWGVNDIEERQTLTKFFVHAFGGPKCYDGKNMWRAHENIYNGERMPLHVYNHAVGGLLFEALEEEGVEGNLVRELKRFLMGPLREEVVGSRGGPSESVFPGRGITPEEEAGGKSRIAKLEKRKARGERKKNLCCL